MAFIIPNQQTKELKQLNQNDTSGSLFVTKNITLDRLGNIKLSPPSVAIMTTDDDSNLDIADSLFQSANGLYVNSKEVFNSSSVKLDKLNSLSSNTNHPTPNVEEDGIYFNGTEVVTDDNGLVYKSAATAWTVVSPALGLTAGSPTQMAVFDSFTSLLVGNDNKVYMVSTGWVVTKTLVLPASYQITSLACNNNAVYIGTRHIANGEAKMFTWDGTSTGHNGSYGVGTFEIFALRAYKQSCALITSLGELLQFNGGGFTRLAILPAYFYNKSWADPLNDHSKISNRGMVVDGEYIYLRLDSKCNSKIDVFTPNFAGGVWCFDPAVGLHCKYTPSYSRVDTVALNTGLVDTGTDELTVTTAPVTGTPVFYEAVSTPSLGLTDFTPYYAIKTSSTTIKLATTYSNAIAGTAIDLTSTGNDFQKIYIINTNDYGWSMSNDRGSIGILSPSITGNNALTERAVFTAQLHAKQNASTAKTVINVVSPKLPNIGYFITPKLNSLSLEDQFNKLSIKYKELKTDDSITIKYKLIDRPNMPRATMGSNLITSLASKTGTWTSTTTFTTPYDLSDVTVGDEIEITSGVGAGFIAHVSAKEDSGGTYTITLDEAFIFAVSGDVMFFAVDNWTKINTITSTTQNGNGFTTLPIDKKSKFVQVKVVLKGVDITIEELQIGNQTFKPTK